MPFQFDPNMSLVRPQDAMGLLGGALPSGYKTDIMNMANGTVQGAIGGVDKGWGDLGMNTQAMDAAKMMPNQYPGSPQNVADNILAADQQRSQQDAFKRLAQGMQGMGRGMQQQMPSGNTAQIIRDQNQFRFPQQQMAQALRNRG